MVSREGKFRQKLVKYLDTYLQVSNNKIKYDAKKIVDSITSENLHNMAENFLKTNEEYKNKKGGRKSRKKKNKSRRVQRGGEWDRYYILEIVISVGSAILGTIYNFANNPCLSNGGQGGPELY